MTTAQEFNYLLIFIYSLGRAFGIPEKIIEKKLFYAMDSKEKNDGIFNEYRTSLKTEDNMIIPYNGTKYLLDYMGITEEQWRNKLDN